MQKIGVWAGVFMSIGSKGTVINLFSAVKVLSFQTQIEEISVKRIRATLAYEQQG